MLLRKDQLRQTTWWLNTHFSLAMSLLSLTLTLEMNSQSRIFRSYRPVWFTKDRLMNIHNFPFYSSPSVVFKYNSCILSCNFKKWKHAVFLKSY